MKIRVRFEVSENQRLDTFDLEDLGVTEKEWNLMDEEKKRELLMDAIKEQPYWAVDTFSEDEKKSTK